MARQSGLMVALVAAVIAVGDARAQAVLQDKHSPIPTCPQRALTADVESLLRPVLLANVAARRADREWDTAYKDSFYRLLELRSPVAHEAQAALMAYYVGEHYGEELLEVAESNPKVFRPLIAKYGTCRPSLSFEAQLHGVVVLRTLYEHFENDTSGKQRAVEQGVEADER